MDNTAAQKDSVSASRLGACSSHKEDHKIQIKKKDKTQKNIKKIKSDDGNNQSNVAWHGARCGTSRTKKVVEESLRMESRRSSHKQTSMRRTQRNQQQQTGPSIPRFVIGLGKSFVICSTYMNDPQSVSSDPSLCFFMCMFIHVPGLFLWCCMTRIATIEAALDADQLQAWQAFYDGVSGMSSCSKCNKRDDPCSCGWGSNSYGPGVLCEGDSITKINLYACSLSGESAYSFSCHRVVSSFHHDMLSIGSDQADHLLFVRGWLSRSLLIFPLADFVFVLQNL